MYAETETFSDYAMKQFASHNMDPEVREAFNRFSGDFNIFHIADDKTPVEETG